MSVVVLSGGVGGAKLSLGFYHLLPAGELTVAVNTADDFNHLGLRICPDIDTTLYTLANLANQQLGWGRADESWHFIETLENLGRPSWFRLGDRDLALHIARTEALAAGQTLSAFTSEIAKRWQINANIIPMTEQCVSTEVVTAEGAIAFQDYFVRQQCQPSVTAIRFTGVDEARPAATLIQALQDPALQAIVIAPSNPYLSIAPILAIPGMTSALRQSHAPLIAVTPVIGNQAVKGPTTKIMTELGLTPSAATVARYYGDLIDGFLLDTVDSDLADEIVQPTLVCNTLMKTLDDRIRVAGAVLELADQLNKPPRGAVGA